MVIGDWLWLWERGRVRRSRKGRRKVIEGRCSGFGGEEGGGC